MDEVSRLDLQLENSLWVSKGEEQKLFIQEISLHQLISRLRPEWPDVEIHLRENALLKGDQQALQSVLRNLLQNARFHGNATRIEIQTEKIGDKRLAVIFQDNGQGFVGDRQNLGREMLSGDNTQSNGIGLYLTRSLLNRMNSEISFPASSSGFQARLEIPGHLDGGA
jgi:signal transduction histidine kinase